MKGKEGLRDQIISLFVGVEASWQRPAAKDTQGSILKPTFKLELPRDAFSISSLNIYKRDL